MCERGSLTWIRSRGIDVQVDSCLAPIIHALNEGGVTTTGSCCGHGEDVGHIALQDGRSLMVITLPQDRGIIQELRKHL